ncbi:MAG: glutamine--fructose-6-phosphate transaminase (isomerizing) [Thermoleophilaceae bacterium]|nr:glutamine--fructose-6-phosphate transaminase (isomerizing) [Thermoleophilaceae bacterium]
MCGIVGYVGPRPGQELLLRGLEKLEYRGYDSAGLSLVAGEGIESIRAVGNLSFLREAVHARAAVIAGGGVAVAEPPPTTGIGHTRWATHGAVTEANAHPHSDTEDRVHIVLNGIVENHLDLRRRLVADGAEFTSETDAEVVAHLIAAHYAGDLLEAVRAAYGDLRGHYSFVAVCADEPGLLVAARKETPLVIGLGEGESFLASAVPAFLRETRDVIYMNDDEFAAVRAGAIELVDAAGRPREPRPERVEWDEDVAEKAGYETFMLKEIHEQPGAVAETIGDRLPEGERIELDAGLSEEQLAGIRRVVVVACGTSYHAGLVGRYAIEQWARLPVEMDIASEYRYRNPVVGPGDLVIGITQSGETADTLAAMRLARRAGATVLAVSNVMGSQATREADGTLFTRAGLEIGVAATKTFVSQVAAMYLLALKLAELHGTLEPDDLLRLVEEMRRLPDLLADVIESVDGPVAQVAEEWQHAGFFLYLGRHIGLAVCLEGALKLKEVSYIPTDAYAAGEMKHGPIALLDQRTPVVCVATDAPVLEKMLSNVSEVRARGAHVLAVATEGSLEVAEHAESVFWVPRTDWILQPILAVVPLQLLAYRIARARGLNVDQPRNLAKTVTVE